MSSSTNQGQSTSALEMRLQVVKEVVTAVLAFMLVGFTLVTAFNVMAMAGDQAKIKDAMSVLTLLFGLAGVVIGYYFGRIPSDARAAQSQQMAQNAEREMSSTHTKMELITNQVNTTVNRMHDTMMKARMSPESLAELSQRNLGPEATILATLVSQVSDDLKQLENVLSLVRRA